MIVVWILLGLIAAVLVLAAVLPSRFTITKTITIARSPADVYRKVSDLNQYREWNPWQKMEPTSQQTVTGEPSTVGHRYAWNGKKIGIGSLTLRSGVPGQAVDFDLQFIKPWKSSADDTWRLEPEAGGTRVIWSNTGALPYPMGRLFGPLISKGLNKQFEQGLSNLKALCEQD